MQPNRKTDFLIAAGLFLLGILTRVPFRSRFLYHWDSVNFALGLEHLDIYQHQPHPPGYFLYVMTGRWVRLLVGDANASLVWMSVLAAGLTAAATFWLGRSLWNRGAGIAASLLFLTSPLFWFHGEVALSYMVEALFVVLVALLCYGHLKGTDDRVWLSALVLGVAGGFRPNTMVFMLPLWAVAAWRYRWRRALGAAGVLAGVCLAWLAPMIVLTGGMVRYTEALRAAGEIVAGESSFSGIRQLAVNGFRLGMFTFYGLGAGIVPLAVGGLYRAVARWKRRPHLSPEVWPFSEHGRGNLPNLLPAGPKEQKENIFRCSGETAATKNHLLLGAVEAARGPCRGGTGKKQKLRGGGAAAGSGGGVRFSLFLWWLMPSLLFYTLIHIRQPGHTFTFMPALLLLLGGLLGSGALPGLARGWTWTLTGLVVLVNALFFLTAPPSLFGGQHLTLTPPTWPTLRARDASLETRIGHIRAHLSPGETVILANGLDFRHPDFYLREYPVVRFAELPVTTTLSLPDPVGTVVLFGEDLRGENCPTPNPGALVSPDLCLLPRRPGQTVVVEGNIIRIVEVYQP